VVIPRFEQLKKEGQAGQQKLTQYSRYLTIGLAILQSTGFIALARSGQLLQGSNSNACNNLLYHQDLWSLTTMVMCMTAGTGVIMWLGELITDRGVGNGMSVLMFTSIAARIPSEGHVILQNAGGFAFTLILLLGIAIIVAVVFVEQAQRRIPVQYAKRMVGRRQYGGTSTYLPLKVNQAGVIPVIFASSLLYIPQLINQLINGNSGGGGSFERFLNTYILDQTKWSYLLIYFVLIIFFSYFYVGITFDPVERADDMKKYGGFIPGIRPGRPTAEYLQFVLSRITFPGSLYLGIVAVLPNFFFNITSGNNQNFPFGGTAVLIMVGVALDTVKQIESQLMQRNYEGFLR
jgi:preprotein translocase subunit SecY